MSDTSPVPLPAPDDLAGWKAADRRVFDRFRAYFETADRPWSPRAVKRYFGEDDIDSFLEAHADQAVAASYAAWAVLDYRPTYRSKTQAEKMLEKGLPRPEEVLLRARMESVPTLYRIEAHDPKAGTVTLEDILLGGRVVVNDRLMSENIEDGVFICARVFPAGSFRFLELAGPPLGSGIGFAAVDYLQSCNLRFTPESLRQNAHAFGWLWGWKDARAARGLPILRNTDDEDFLLHSASFLVEDEAVTRRALLARGDIDFDEAANQFVWWRDAEDNPRVLGDMVALGRIEFIGDELVLDVNSAERFEAGRRWLEELDGVRFQSVRRRSQEELLADRTPDELLAPREPVEMTPELLAAVRQSLDDHCMAWLDMALPVLSGQTPRQACRTVEGRRRVAALIRSMPDAGGDVPIPPPREAMLRELGLEVEPVGNREKGSSRPTTPGEHSTPQSNPPAGPNAPCPCGSGRKYKKCCGRLG
jgi:hypothetical protein